MFSSALSKYKRNIDVIRSNKIFWRTGYIFLLLMRVCNITSFDEFTFYIMGPNTIKLSSRE